MNTDTLTQQFETTFNGIDKQAENGLMDPAHVVFAGWGNYEDVEFFPFEYGNEKFSETPEFVEPATYKDLDGLATWLHGSETSHLLTTEYLEGVEEFLDISVSENLDRVGINPDHDDWPVMFIGDDGLVAYIAPRIPPQDAR